MKMKKLKIYLSTVMATVIISSCSLDETPNGFLSTQNFYQTEKDANAALVYAYAILPEIEYYSREFILVTEIPTEDVTIKPDGGVNNFELQNLNTSTNNTDVTTIWRYGYIGANRANAIIEHVPGISSMAEADRNQIVGEGYFLRALHYFNLVRLFGSIPLHKVPVASLDQVNLPKSSIEEVYDLIISDLQTAGDKMGAAKLVNRANKTAAWALLSKVYLHLASSKASDSQGYDFVSSADEMYTNAMTYAGKVINEQTDFGFEPELLDIWDNAKENGQEHIFSASTDISGAAEGNYSKLPLMFTPYIDGAIFKLEDGTPVASGWNHFGMEPGIYNSYKDNDKRKTDLIVSTVYVNGSARNLNITDGTGSPRPFTRKFIDPNRVGDKTGLNTPILRFSDILLVYAEAEGPTAEGYAAINKVRARAGLNDLTAGLDVQTFRDSVVVERKWELAFEGNRLFDLRRTNTMKKVLVDELNIVNNIQSGEYFFSIPQSEVDLNPYID
jgi:hypothetical protein